MKLALNVLKQCVHDVDCDYCTFGGLCMTDSCVKCHCMAALDEVTQYCEELEKLKKEGNNGKTENNGND